MESLPTVGAKLPGKPLSIFGGCYLFFYLLHLNCFLYRSRRLLIYFKSVNYHAQLDHLDPSWRQWMQKNSRFIISIYNNIICEIRLRYVNKVWNTSLGLVAIDLGQGHLQAQAQKAAIMETQQLPPISHINTLFQVY